MTQPARFWDRIAEKYSKKPIADEAAYQRKLEVTRGHFRPDMEVLELGCGTGSTAIVHAHYVKQVRAIDISAKMIEIARGKAEAAGVSNVVFEQSTVDDVQVADESLDVVLALSVLHLLDNWETVITRVQRMLKPGGVFVSSTPCLGDNLKFFKFIGPVGRWLGLMPLLRVFSTRQLLDRLTSAGFSIDHQWQPGRNKGVFIVAKKG